MKAIHILFYINIEILNKRHHISVEINVWWDCMINNNKSVCRSPLLHLRYFYIIFIAAYIALLNAIKIVTSLFYTTKQTHYVGEDNNMLLDRKMFFFLFRRINQSDAHSTVHHQATWISPFNLDNVSLNPVRVHNAWDACLLGHVKSPLCTWEWSSKGAIGWLINHYLNLFSSTMRTFYTSPNFA